MKDMLSEIAGSLSGVSKTITLLFAAVWVMVFIVLVVSFSVLVGERKKRICPAPRDGNVTKKTGRDFIERNSYPERFRRRGRRDHGTPCGDSFQRAY